MLVFHANDFTEDSRVLKALSWGSDPDRQPWGTAVRSSDGGFELRPPDPEYGRHPLLDGFRATPFLRTLTWMVQRSWFVAWAARELGVEPHCNRGGDGCTNC